MRIITAHARRNVTPRHASSARAKEEIRDKYSGGGDCNIYTGT